MSNPALSSFFLASPPSLRLFEMLEISHPLFNTNPHRIVRNATRGVEGVFHEGPDGPYNYLYLPARITPVTNDADLLQSLEVSLGDLSSIIQPEISRLTQRGGMSEKPIVTFRTYSSADLSAPKSGPLVLEITELTTNSEGSSFRADAPEVNESGSGEKYLVDVFPMLRAFL
jgi:Domain of unknown function (DUF1833)